jgi:hypothetical protein
LAKWLEDCAKNGGQPSAKMLDELEAQQQETNYRRSLPYAEREWQANLLRKDSGATLTQMNLFAKGVEDPWLLERHRAEAALASPTLKHGNLTVAMAIAKIDPRVREAHKAAGELFAAWQAEQQQKAAA